jgi:tetratricopeptide (TPR) repeat protein/tRNA A-37 threonylcarbamoyl transferase component Bud32
MTVTSASNDVERLRRALMNRYAIEREIGRGGMAYVYLGRDVKHDRRVAIKLLRPELASSIGSARFLREVSLTATLQHPHILPLYDSGEADGLLYYVTPYVTGETLRQRLERERQLPIEDALALIRSLAGALQHAHERGVIHRDIKPENILLQGGHPLLADFGIALALGDTLGNERLTATGLSLGTPQYMSPEQATGERTIGAQSDIYSLAAVAYEVLVGEPPVTGPSAKAIVARLLTESPRPIRTVRETVSPEVEAAILKALAKLPADRFRSASEFARALEAGSPGTTAAVSARRTNKLVLSALLTLLLVGAAWWGRARMMTAEADNLRQLALLPCEDFDPRTGYTSAADRWSEEMIQKLVRIGGLSPKSWVSVGRYKGTRLSVREVGEQLNAGTLVRCRVAEGPGRVRLAVEVIRARDERVVWANDYERPADAAGINAAQALAARDIAERLGIGIAPRNLRAVERPLTHDSAAFVHYRLGRHFLGLRGPANLRKSVEHFQSAIARDSTFADAYVGLSDALVFWSEHESRPSREYYPRIAQLLRKALSIDATIAEAHTQLALYLLEYTHDWTAAEEEHRQALALNPSSVDAHLWYGWHLQTAGRLNEAVAEFDRAVELDPTSHLARGQLVRALAFAGNEERALAELQQGLEINPRWGAYYHHLAVILLRRGQRDSAIAVVDRHITQPSSWFNTWLYAALGRRETAQRVLDSLIALNATRPVDPVHIAAIQAGLGNSEEALTWLERGYADRSGLLLFLLGPHPAFDALRGHPRFRELRKKAGFKG